MASRSNCLVCCDPVKKVSRRKENSNLLEEELCVYFFVKKFILRDIVEGRILSSPVEGLVGDDEVDFEKYLRNGKSLGECVGFCSFCQDSVKQAKETYTNLCQLLVQLSKLQSSLQRKLRNSFHEEKEARRTDNSLRSTIRRTLKGQLGEDVEVTLGSAKVEVEPETLYSAIVKTEPNEDDFIDEEFGLEDEECNLDLKEFVISPSSSQVGGDKEELNDAVESKKPKPAAERKSVKLKRQLNTNSNSNRKNLKNDEAVPSTSVEPETSSISLVLRRGRRPTNKRNRVPLERRTCPTCGAVFAKRITMKYHLNAVHEKQVAFYCDVDGCDQVFYLKEARNSHQKRHLSKEQIRHLILANKFDLVRLSEGTQFNLEETMEEIERLESREYSELIVNEVLKRTCPKCRKIFEREALMKYHLKMHHNSDASSDSRHVCEKCGKSYALMSSYKNHIRFDHVEIVTTDGSEKPARPFVCDIEGCDKSFSRPEYVKNHKNHFHRLGKNLGPFLCSFCGRELRTGSGLKRHILTHHTENPPRRFNCHMCEKSFLTSTLLKKHLMCKSHGGEGRPWAPSKWDPKYNKSRKKRVKTASENIHQPIDSGSLNIPEEGNRTASSQFNEPVWFRDQTEGIGINTNPTVTTTGLGIVSKGLDCPSQIFQPPMLL